MTASGLRRSQRGLALVSVLWGISVLSLIAAAMLSASVMTARIDRNVSHAVEAGAVADAAVNVAVLSLLDPRVALQPRVDGTALGVVFSHVPVRLAVQDETGRIDLNYADKDTLAGAFASAGVGADEAQTIAQRVVDLRPSASAGGSSPIVFRNVDDVTRVPGVSRTVFARVRPLLTVYSRDTTVNASVAPRAVLLALPGMDKDRVDALLAERAKQQAVPLPDRNAVGSPLGIAGHAFAITAEVDLDGAHVRREAVVLFTGDQTKPYLFLAWR